MSLNKKSFIVTFHATLVAKGVLELNEVSEGNNLRLFVGEVLNELNDVETLSSDDVEDEELVEEIDPIDEEHIVDDSVEDSEVQGIGRATEVEPQEEDPENPSTAQGGTLPNQ
ncbi:hypothetical protein CPT_MarsHill_050 [Staphylococcus phage MarsHill]|nr:hypothetical protein CPT_MarsHill_050 [Staphylococcus phage MarsHill]QQO92706.1 hypothetical protein CPT_Madawaska_049 [Staphylococcus phage Madawaska]